MVGRQRRAPAAPKAKHLLRRGAAKLGRLGRDNGGSVVVLAGFLFPVVIGGMGLGAETGYWYWTERKLQHAADVSVYAAAVRASQGERNSSTLYTVALHVADEAGFVPGKSPKPVGLNEPDKTVEVVPYNGTATQHHGKDSVEVVITETLPRLFTSIFTGEPLAITGRAIAIIEYGSTGCVLALSSTASPALKLSGSTEIELKNCDVAANSVAQDSFSMQGSAQLSTGCVHTSGGASVSNELNLDMEDCEEVREYSPKALDPYRDVVEPEEVGNCESRNFTPSGTYNLTPYAQGHPSGLPVYRFCGSVQFKGTVNFGPGLYIFSCPASGNCDNVEVSANAGAVLTGITPPGVTFYLAPGIGLDFNGNATITLTARSDDPYAGILFFSSRETAGVSHTVNGGAGGTFQGAVYFPTGDIKYAGGASTTGTCTQVIGNTVEFTGNSKVGSDCTGTGVREMDFGQKIAIVE